MYRMKTWFSVFIFFSGCLPTSVLLLWHLININYSLLNSVYFFKVAATLSTTGTGIALAQQNTVEPHQFMLSEVSFGFCFIF